MTAESGRIDVAWHLRDQLLVLSWTERGGPSVGAVAPGPGFGSVLIRDAVVHQFGGSIEQDWRGEGLLVTLTIPLAALAN